MAAPIPVALSTPSARADGGADNATVRSPQTWYAYVEAGETFSTTFTKNSNLALGSGAWDPEFVVTSPSGQEQSCVIARSDPNDVTTCATTQTATETGVWSVALRSPLDPSDPNHRFGWVRADWEVSVGDDDGPVEGRVWSDHFWMADQMAGPLAGPVDLSLWYQTEYGFLYRVDRLGMNGIDSDFRSNAFGIVDPDTCASAYSSTGVGSPLVDITRTDCDFTPTKIFFAEPADDLPDEVRLPDGTTTWLIREPVEPALDDVSFAPAGAGSRSGTLTARFSNFEGNARVLVDTNGDGRYDDPTDRSILMRIVAGHGAVDFDGLDAAGTDIPPTSPVGFRVVADGYGEVHFTDGDIETLPGGIRVTRLNGPADGTENRVFWNDEALTTPRGDAQYDLKCSHTPTLAAGVAGEDSIDGVHGWDRGTCGIDTAPIVNAPPSDPTNGGTWGNNRVIDNWVWMDAGLDREIVLPAAEAVVTREKSSDPVSGSRVVAGQEIAYSLTFTNTGDAPAALDWIDEMGDVLDDAESTVPASDTEGVVATLSGTRLRVTGELPAGATAVVAYRVRVGEDGSRGDDELSNYLLAPGEAAACDAEGANCTTHPVDDSPEVVAPPVGSEPTAPEPVTPTPTLGAAPTTPDLPLTGTDPLGPVMASVLLAALGAAVAVLRRVLDRGGAP